MDDSGLVHRFSTAFQQPLVEKWVKHMRNRVLFVIVVALLAVGPLASAPPTLHAAGIVMAAPADAPTSSVSGLEALLYGLAAFGAIRIKDTGSLAKKFVQRASAASKDYEEGVKASGADWEAGARNGAENYRIAVTQAASEGRFEKGVAAAGSAKFVARAASLGAQRFGPGVQASEGEWAKGAAPYLDALKGLELPARRPRGQNADRANAVAQRLHQMRVGK